MVTGHKRGNLIKYINNEWAKEEYEKGNLMKSARILRVFYRRLPKFKGGNSCVSEKWKTKNI